MKKIQQTFSELTQAIIWGEPKVKWTRFVSKKDKAGLRRTEPNSRTLFKLKLRLNKTRLEGKKIVYFP